MPIEKIRNARVRPDSRLSINGFLALVTSRTIAKPTMYNVIQMNRLITANMAMSSTGTA